MAFQIPDLTLIARRHGGEFQRDWVERSIDGRQKIPSHGAYTMPVWREDFSQIGDPDAERAFSSLASRLSNTIVYSCPALYGLLQIALCPALSTSDWG